MPAHGREDVVLEDLQVGLVAVAAAAAAAAAAGCRPGCRRGRGRGGGGCGGCRPRRRCGCRPGSASGRPGSGCRSGCPGRLARSSLRSLPLVAAVVAAGPAGGRRCGCGRGSRCGPGCRRGCRGCRLALAGPGGRSGRRWSSPAVVLRSCARLVLASCGLSCGLLLARPARPARSCSGSCALVLAGGPACSAGAARRSGRGLWPPLGPPPWAALMASIRSPLRIPVALMPSPPASCLSSGSSMAFRPPLAAAGRSCAGGGSGRRWFRSCGVLPPCRLYGDAVSWHVVRCYRPLLEDPDTDVSGSPCGR